MKKELMPKDFSHLVGLTEKEARNVLEEKRMILRVTRIDSKPQEVFMDRRTNRINVAIVDGKISAIQEIG